LGKGPPNGEPKKKTQRTFIARENPEAGREKKGKMVCLARKEGSELSMHWAGQRTRAWRRVDGGPQEQGWKTNSPTKMGEMTDVSKKKKTQEEEFRMVLVLHRPIRRRAPRRRTKRGKWGERPKLQQSNRFMRSLKNQHGGKKRERIVPAEGDCQERHKLNKLFRRI